MNDLHNLRTGLGMDVHAFAPGRKLILGGVDIPHHQGLDGHSDADVLAHAISDALLGAVRGGDIGKLFPDTDPAYKDADSLKLLAEVLGIKEPTVRTRLVRARKLLKQSLKEAWEDEQPKLKEAWEDEQPKPIQSHDGRGPCLC